MIELDDLADMFQDLGFIEPTTSQLQMMRDCYIRDFVDNPFEVDGSRVIVKSNPSHCREFRGLPETFVHLITRENKLKGLKVRQFDKWRANKIHWIKPILLQRSDSRIKYFEEDEDGVVKKFYWFDEGNFIIILKPISVDLLIITAFALDDRYERGRFEEKYRKFVKK